MAPLEQAKLTQKVVGPLRQRCLTMDIDILSIVKHLCRRGTAQRVLVRLIEKRPALVNHIPKLSGLLGIASAENVTGNQRFVVPSKSAFICRSQPSDSNL
jgi:hypothetical protein